MADPQNTPRFEEQAALHALGLLDADGVNRLLDAARTDAATAQLVLDFDEVAAQLSLDAPEQTPPPQLRAELMSQLPKRNASATVLTFSQWFPYAIAACLMILGIGQMVVVMRLKSQLASTQTRYIALQNDAERLRASNAMINLRLATLEAKDAAYTTAKILVAWDPYQKQGSIALESLPPAPAGHDYQLWVLDPNAAAPLSAGVLTGGRPFTVQSVSMPNPGFAISLEPTGGSPAPTGPILFAVAPGP